jgi:hypothetical protein
MADINYMKPRYSKYQDPPALSSKVHGNEASEENKKYNGKNGSFVVRQTLTSPLSSVPLNLRIGS